MIYIASDWHFNHNKNFLYEPRGFSSVEEMNQELIKRHNKIVNKNDIVYVLGDLCLGGEESLEKNKQLIESMNGKLYIAIGNHCTNKRIEMYKTLKNVEAVDYGFRLSYKKMTFWLTHYPTIVVNYDDKPNYNIHGHTHDTVHFHKEWPHCFDVSPETNNCYPMALDEIVNLIKKFNNETKGE